MENKHLQNGSKAFIPAAGWVLVKNGSISEVKQAIIEYDELAQEVVPDTFKVELHPKIDGGVAVLFPDGLPTYDLANITGWLNEPPGLPNVFDAVS